MPTRAKLPAQDMQLACKDSLHMALSVRYTQELKQCYLQLLAPPHLQLDLSRTPLLH